MDLSGRDTYVNDNTSVLIAFGLTSLHRAREKCFDVGYCQFGRNEKLMKHVSSIGLEVQHLRRFCYVLSFSFAYLLLLYDPCGDQEAVNEAVS